MKLYRLYTEGLVCEVTVSVLVYRKADDIDTVTEMEALEVPSSPNVPVRRMVVLFGLGKKRPTSADPLGMFPDACIKETLFCTYLGQRAFKTSKRIRKIEVSRVSYGHQETSGN